MSSWNLSQCVLKLFPWTRGFVPNNINHTSAQVWVRIHGLSQEHWSPKIICVIVSSLGTPIYIDLASNKPPIKRGKPQLQNMDMGRRIGPMKTKVVYREKEHVHPTVVVNHDRGDQDQSLRGNTSGVNKVLKEKNV
ncbi:hypothetical protein KIW84_015858 [Lathyrus oleraceus]|uniref:DUF4283 domain-containing protein n=1 Tax=Pisum sativum TaxID=3888 RepID=A0A9D5H193_PEA|nr:hypothetical protein KIW84_015858 [Pisum sativum]